MTNLLILAVIQGFTEFLPISSSAHLVIFQKVFGFQKHDLTLTILLHFGTVLSLLFFFRRDIFSLFNQRKLLLLILFGNLMTAIFVFLFLDFIEETFNSPRYVGIFLIFTGIILFVIQKVSRGKKSIKDVKLPDAMLVGLFQGISAIPGLSRSGLTISSSMLVGLKREDAFIFSFLLSIPAVIGATLFEYIKVGLQFEVKFILPVLISFLCGLFALSILLKAIKGMKLHFFSLYCLVVGAVVALIF